MVKAQQKSLLAYYRLPLLLIALDDVKMWYTLRNIVLNNLLLASELLTFLFEAPRHNPIWQ